MSFWRILLKTVPGLPTVHTRDQGLSREQLHTVFLALIVSRLRYALPAWSGFLKTDQTGQINAFLKRLYKYGFPVN